MHHLLEVHRNYSCKTSLSTFLVLLFVGACSSYASLHVTIRQCSKSIFLGGCVITWVAYQHCFLQLFRIYIEVRSQCTLFGAYIRTCISHIYSVFSFFLSVSTVWFLCILFRTFIFTLITMELLIFFFLLNWLLLLISVCIFNFFF